MAFEWMDDPWEQGAYLGYMVHHDTVQRAADQIVDEYLRTGDPNVTIQVDAPLSDWEMREIDAEVNYRLSKYRRY